MDRKLHSKVPWLIAYILFNFRTLIDSAANILVIMFYYCFDIYIAILFSK